MKLALVQCRSLPGEIPRNAEKHRHFIHEAAQVGADWIIFPELSLSAYEPDLAAEVALEITDPYWDQWQLLSNELQVNFGLGMPIRVGHGIVIGMLVFRPGQSHRLYAKQYLHSDELPFFVSGNEWDGIITSHQLAISICYELSVPAHAEYAQQHGASNYLASVAKFQSGILAAHQRLSTIAQEHNMNVFMANTVGPADNGVCAGQSAIWAPSGDVIAQLGSEEEAILLYDSVTASACAVQSGT